MIERTTVLMLTLNEEANLARTLNPLRPFPRVIILDSGSTDATLDIARSYPNVQIHTRDFDTHANQWNHALQHCGAQSEWILALDADYVLTPEILAEMSRLAPTPAICGYFAAFRYCIGGKPLSGSLYPPVTLLYRREGAIYVEDGHAQKLVAPGAVEPLRGKVLHDDRKPFSTWLKAQDRYARIEAAHLLSSKWNGLRWRDRLRRLCFVTPWLVPLYCLTVHRGILDGRYGLTYALERAVAEAVLALHLLEATLKSRSPR